MPDTDGHVEAGSVKKNTENRDRSNDGFDSVEFDTPLPSEETKETFSFRKLPSYQKITLVCLVSMEFCAAASFSLLAPFFPAEVKLNCTVLILVFYILKADYVSRFRGLLYICM